MTSTTPNTIWAITGANRGIGLGMVQHLLARPSTTVIATVRNTEAAATLTSSTADITRGRNSTLHIVQLDFSTAIEPQTIYSGFMSTIPDLTHIDTLINNAAFAPSVTTALTTPAHDLRATFEVNTIAPLLTFQGLWPLLKSSPTGSPKLITITSSLGSIGAMEPMPAGAYGPSKAAANWLTKALHIEHADDGLIALAIHPGWVQTHLGYLAAENWGVSAGPPMTVEESVTGVLDVVDGASREWSSGRFLMFNGEELPW